MRASGIEAAPRSEERARSIADSPAPISGDALPSNPELKRFPDPFHPIHDTFPDGSEFFLAQVVASEGVAGPYDPGLILIAGSFALQGLPVG